MKNWNIRTKILVGWFFVLLLIIIVDLSFYSIINKLSKSADINISYYKFFEDYNKYLNAQKEFLIEYQKDPVFFRTEQSEILRKQDLAYLKVKNDLQGLIEYPNISVNQQNRFSQILTLVSNKHTYFKTLTHKLYLRGSFTIQSGLVGKIYDIFVTIKQNNQDPKLARQIDVLYSDFLTYLVTFDEKQYQKFLQDYTVLNRYLQTQEFAPFTGTLDTTLASAQTYNYSDKLLHSLSDLKARFRDLVRLDSEIGLLNLNSGILLNLKSLESNATMLVDKMRQELVDMFTQLGQRSKLVYLSFFLTLIIITIIVLLYLNNFIFSRFDKIKEYINPLQYGQLPEKLDIETHDEIGDLIVKLNIFIDSLQKTAEFAVQLGQGNFDVEYKPLSDKDILGNALLRLREDLKRALEEEEKRKQEERIRQWTNEGISKFADILRQKTENLEELARIVIKNLVNYLNANQGAFFYLNDEDKNNVRLELLATYAYNRERKKKKYFKLGEGLVGTVALEKSTVYMTDIPEDYISITSGLGGAKPRSLLIVPLNAEDKIIGVIELASFNELKDYEIKFVERVAESIAATFSMTKINEITNKLLNQAQMQAAEMAAKEEEMRQNLEELKATQEEAARREAELQSLLNGIENATFVIFLDLNGFIVRANKNLLEFLGISKNDFFGHHISEFDIDGELAKDEFWEALRNGELKKYTRHFKIGDKEYWFDEFYVPILDRNDNVQRFIALAYDITKRVKQQQLLEQQKQELQEREKELKKLLEQQEAARKLIEEQKARAESMSRRLQANEQVLKKALDEAKQQKEKAEQMSQRLAEEKMQLAQEYEDYLSSKEMLNYLERKLQEERRTQKQKVQQMEKALEEKDKKINELLRQIEELKKQRGDK